MIKPFTWSFSSLKAFETCAFRFQQVNLLKAYKEPRSKELDWGDRVHYAIRDALQGKTPLPEEMKDYQKWIDRVGMLPGKLYVEQKYAIDKDFLPVADYFGATVWYRGIGDAVKICEDRGVILDWKTGAVKPDSVQLMLMAQCLFSHFPQLNLVHTAFVWLKDDTTTAETFTREGIRNAWIILLERVKKMEAARTSGVYPKQPSGLCKHYCPVTTCEFHGKGSF